MASRRLEASWRVLGLGLGSQVLGLGLGLEPKVLIGVGPETVLALLVFKQILCKVLRCSSASVNEHNMYGFCFRYIPALVATLMHSASYVFTAFTVLRESAFRILLVPLNTR